MRKHRGPINAVLVAIILVLILNCVLFPAPFLTPSVTASAVLTKLPFQNNNTETSCTRGRTLFSQNKFEEALPLLRSGLDNREQSSLGPSGELGDCAFDLGTLYLNQYDLISALDTYMLALKLYQATDGQQEGIKASLYAMGQIYRMQEQYLEAMRLFQELASLARTSNDQAREIDAYAGLAVIHYALNEQVEFQDTLKYLQSLPGMTEEETRKRVIQEIARYQVAHNLQQNESMVAIYRFLVGDIDSDGVVEMLVAGGTTEASSSPFGIGTCLLFDWQGNELQYHVLVSEQGGFQNFLVKDINQDGRLEIVIIWRAAGSSLDLIPFILTYDGQNLHSLADPNDATRSMGIYSQGNIDFKDLDADGTDEVLIWESRWEIGMECHWCAHIYEVYVFDWNGQQYGLEKQLQTQEKYDASQIVGRTFSMFGLPVDIGRHLRIESSRTELSQLKNERNVSVEFVNQLLEDSYSFWQEELYPEGEEVANIALEASANIPDKDMSDFLAADALTLRGLCRSGQGNALEAREDIKKALTLFENLSKRSTSLPKDSLTGKLMGAYNNSGIINYPYDPQAALVSFTRAAEMASKQNDLDSKSIAVSNIGHIYLFMGEFDGAYRQYTQALAWDEELDRKLGQSINHWGIASIYSAKGDFTKAIQQYKIALDLAVEIGNIDRAADIYRDIGRSYYELQDYTEALTILEYSLLLSSSDNIRESQGLIYDYLADVYAAQGDMQRAEEYYRKVLTTEQRENLSSPYGAFWRAHYGLSQLAKSQNQDVQALEQFKSAIEIIEHQRNTLTIEALSVKFSNDQTKQAVYSGAVDLLNKMGYQEEAFEYAERARARAFLDEMASGPVNFHAGVDSTLLEKEKTIQNEIAELDAQLSLLHVGPHDQSNAESIAAVETKLVAREADYTQLLTDIKLQSPEVADLVSVDVASLRDTQALLAPTTSLIEYFVMDDHTVAFVISSNLFETFVLDVRREDLVKTITTFRDFASLSNPYPATLKQLYDWLIAPLRDKIKTPMIGVIPHGVLHYLPFAALTDGKHYLGDQYILFTLPSASALRFIQEKRKANSGALVALGNPTIDEPLPTLQFAEKEVQAITRLYNVDPLIGTMATESAVWTKASAASILHLSAHGEYDSNNPLFSKIYLASDSQNDGRLEVHEVYELDLRQNTNLVVLSACQTDVGAVSAGDEVTGLNRAFIYAGTPTVIASLWNVDDAATALLMERFYAYLQLGVTKGYALKRAQEDVRMKYPNPYYWAAFVLTGDAGTTVQVDSVQGNSNNHLSLWSILIIVIIILIVAGVGALRWQNMRARL